MYTVILAGSLTMAVWCSVRSFTCNSKRKGDGLFLMAIANIAIAVTVVLAGGE